MHGGRVYVQDMGWAGDFIERGGWVDRPVEIVGLGMETEDERVDGTEPAVTPVDRRARLDSLMKKPALTRGEQMFLLQAMKDGLEI